jgi:Tfp pilus assembly protein PilF
VYLRSSLHLAFVFTALTAGCTLTQPKPAPIVDVSSSQSQASRNGDQYLDVGLQQYDQGQYKRATSALLQSLEAGLSPAKQVIAHKHLAFIYCTSNKVSLCRYEFNKAIEVDPRFDLAPSEAGHPQWGPVFRSVKSRQPTAS